MKANMGSTDRVIRVVFAVIMVTLFLTDVIQGTLAYVLLGLAAIFVLTSFVSFCPLYLPFGFKTKKD